MFQYITIGMALASDHFGMSDKETDLQLTLKESSSISF
jgi:hypothetical protein